MLNRLFGALAVAVGVGAVIAVKLLKDQKETENKEIAKKEVASKEVVNKETIEKESKVEYIKDKGLVLEKAELTTELLPKNYFLFQKLKLNKDILKKLPNIVDIYPDDKIFQVTPIFALARTIVENMEVSQGLKTSISETEVFTGKQIKDLYENPNENTFLGKYFMKQKI